MLEVARFSNPQFAQSPALQKITLIIEEDQKARLTSDMFVEDAQSTNVKCGACRTRIKLHEHPLPGGPRYDITQWSRHRRTCYAVNHYIECWYKDNCGLPGAVDFLEQMLGLKEAPMQDHLGFIDDFISNTCERDSVEMRCAKSSPW